MATQTLPALHENYVALTRVVKRWDRRLRLQQTLLWLPRSLLPGLAIGLLLAVISWLRPWLLAPADRVDHRRAAGAGVDEFRTLRSGCGDAPFCFRRSALIIASVSTSGFRRRLNWARSRFAAMTNSRRGRWLLRARKPARFASVSIFRWRFAGAIGRWRF